MNTNQKFLLGKTLVVLNANPSLVLQLCPRSTSFANVCKTIETRIKFIHDKVLEDFCEKLREDHVELEVSNDEAFEMVRFHAVHCIDGVFATC